MDDAAGALLAFVAAVVAVGLAVAGAMWIVVHLWPVLLYWEWSRWSCGGCISVRRSDFGASFASWYGKASRRAQMFEPRPTAPRRRWTASRRSGSGDATLNDDRPVLLRKGM